MAKTGSIQLGQVQETLLVPLYGRALDCRRKRPILNDRKAVEMVEAIDWDFQRFGQTRRVVACTLRTARYDEWVRDFLCRHPAGTVVEIGAGLNTRFERLDNGTVHWFDLDLPDVVELRRRFFTDSARRVTLAASVCDSDWMAAVRRSPGPYCFVAEAVLIYLAEPQVRAALAQIARNFPGARLAFDTGTPRGLEHENRDHARRNLDGRFVWACEDPQEIEGWDIGLRLVDSHSLFEIPCSVKRSTSWRLRAFFHLLRTRLPRVANICRLNLFEAREGFEDAGGSPSFSSQS